MGFVFLRYQTLRFMFLDEFSTTSIDVFADINQNTSTHIRERGTWAVGLANQKRQASFRKSQTWSNWQQRCGLRQSVNVQEKFRRRANCKNVLAVVCTSWRNRPT